jgi:uncharacterized membrane protein
MMKKMQKLLPISILILVAALIFALACSWAKPAPKENSTAAEYAEYEKATVTQILTDSTERDPLSDDAWRGQQKLIVKVSSGQYKGTEMLADNYIGPLTSPPLQVGDSAVVILSTYADGSVTASVYEHDRSAGLIIAVALFLIAAIAVGGKTGAKSLVGLAITLACLFWVLIPALMKGAPTLLTVFLVCAYIAIVTLAILGGLQKKTLCAMASTIAGTGMALLFGLLAQSLLHIDGLRGDEVEALLNLKRDGVPIGLRGLLVGGIIISALGAVMDVTMGICSAMQEVHEANSKMDLPQLFRSGMNVGRDMVGTMTNTLILALLGSSFTMILYIYSMNLQPHQLISSPYFSIEVLSSIATSIGVILSIPLTALICAFVYTRKK